MSTATSISKIKRTTRKAALSLFAIASMTQLALADPSASSKPTAPGKKAPTASITSLKKLSNSWEILKTPVVKKSMLQVMGDKYSLFEQSTQELNQSESSGDEIYASGGITGLLNECFTAFCFNIKTQHMQVAVLGNDELNIWGAASKSQLSKPMKDCISALETRRGDKVRFKFEAPNQSSIALDKPNPPATAANQKISLASPTGTYDRESKFAGATLQIKTLAANKLRFSLSAEHGGNSGEASGIVELKNNKGVYRNGDLTLKFHYDGRSFTLNQTAGSAYFGAGVVASGVYKKSSDRTPDISM